MSDDVVIRMDHVSKKYCTSLRRSMVYGMEDIGRNLFGFNSHPGSLRENEFWAVDDVSFELRKGESLGLIGPNGSGKTTLINCITGFIKMDSGKVLYKGKNISNRTPNKIANLGLTRTFQIMRPYYSLPAYKNLIIPLFSPRARRKGGWRGGGKLGDRGTVSIDILEEIGFERDSFVPYKLASSLPTGYLKRLELARCLALGPDVILCDEVFSGLSMSEIASMVPLIEKLQMDGITLVMIEHRLRELFRVASRVMVLNFGQKLTEGIPEEVMQDERVKEAYLGSEKASDYI
jgi:branched-chain amino acid transport system ATP-binding protein